MDKEKEIAQKVREEAPQEMKEKEALEEKEKSTFKGLGVCDELCQACAELHYEKPTEIQTQAIPHALQGRDVIGLAQTGSGKTAAFALPILQSLLEETAPQAQIFYACVVAPTRELCIQISQHFQALGKGLGLRTAVLVGGLDMVDQTLALSKKPHVVVGTPGRMVDHLANTKGFHLRNARFLVLDEADRLLDLDFQVQIHQIVSSASWKGRKTYLYSATMTSKVQKLQRASLKSPVKIQVAPTKYSTVSSLTQNYIFIPARLKDAYLALLLSEAHFGATKTIIFVSTCAATLRLALLLRNLDYPAVAINGKMPQDKRLAALNAFKVGSRSIIVSTDVASRGLDIPNLALVLNYDVPANPKDYVHRVGRTARAGRTGRAICLVSQYDVENLQRIEHVTGRQMTEYPTSEEAAKTLYPQVLEAGRLASNELRALEKKKGGRQALLGGIDSSEATGAEKDITGALLSKRKSGRSFYEKSFARKKKSKRS